MITTIVFDIGQVLAHFRWKEYLNECGYDEDTINKVSNATVLNKIWGEQDRGALSEDELVKLCCEQDPSVAPEVRQLFEDITKLVREYDYSANLIKDIKANGYKVYLLSNYGEKNFMFAKEHFEFIKYVDGMVISYEIKKIKPEPEIYQYLIDKYKINPKEAVFLDDILINLKAAKEFGFHTIHVTEIEKALEDLRDLGVKI